MISKYEQEAYEKIIKLLREIREELEDLNEKEKIKICEKED